MAQHHKWKNRLLSSSLPLEHEVARLFARRGFHTFGEFAYSRKRGADSIDVSADLWLNGLTPFGNRNRITGNIDLVVECKYRMPHVSWLFPEDILNNEDSNVLLGSLLRNVDAFSFYQLNRTPAYDFEEGLHFAYKGIEINISTGEVDDKELRHGVEQLTYALPDVLLRNIYNSALGHPDDNRPFAFLPILVTTADLVVARRDFNIKRVQQASALHDLGTVVPYLVLMNTSTPQFQQHTRDRMSGLRTILQDSRIQSIAAARRHHVDSWDMPERHIADLLDGSFATWRNLFSYVLICNINHCNTLVSTLKRVWSDVFKNQKRSRPPVSGPDRDKHTE